MEESSRDGFVVGVSGGVDSVVVLTLACHAVGAERVLGVRMPSEVTPAGQAADAMALIQNLGCEEATVSIADASGALQAALGTEDRIECGNLHARLRMAVLYALARRRKALVLGTGNRSEWLMGYFTTHGDAAADMFPIIHLYKTEVWRMAEELGVPAGIIRKPPSADLWVGQTDEGELGLTYQEIDQALQSGRMDPSYPVGRRYLETMHKRRPAGMLERLGDA
jgi:NAD+ synthase